MQKTICRDIKTLVFSTIMILGMLSASEFILQVWSWVSPRAKDILSRAHQPLEETVKDERLGWRGNPKHPDHDRKGFRNKFVPNEAAIVALGDSQTYGTNVAPDQAWPQQLEILGKIKTYNMGIGGYGPPQSLLLLEEAINLKPKLIIEAFYAGNDLYDSYHLIYDRKVKLPELENTNESVMKTIAYIESNSPLEQQIHSLRKMGNLYQNNTESLNIKHGALRELLAEYSNIYGAIRAVKNVYSVYKYKRYQSYAIDRWESIKQETAGIKDYYQIYEDDTFKTVFTPEIRSFVINTDDQRIAEGHHICLEIFKLMRRRTKVENIDFLILFIPTKEFIFKDLVLDNQRIISEAYQNLLRNEELMWEKTKEFLLTQKIYFVDALPALRESLRNGNQPYSISWDGHPNGIGHRAIAALVLSKVTGEGLFDAQKNLQLVNTTPKPSKMQ